jgi:DNA polymerase V
MGVVGERTQLELKGTSANKLDHITDKKSITTSRSFGDMVESMEQLQEAVSSFASSCAAKLRQQNSVAQCITVYLLTNFFREDLPKYYNSITLRLPEATDGTLELVNEALKGLRAIYRKGYLYKKAGVIVTELMGNDCVQQNLFYSSDVTKINQINKVLDSVNAKYGRDTLKIAVQGGLLADQKDESWVMKRENLSRNFTTNISDIIECKI